jgi:hypothetical protein
MLAVVPFGQTLRFELTLAKTHRPGGLTPGLFSGYKVNQILDF